MKFGMSALQIYEQMYRSWQSKGLATPTPTLWLGLSLSFTTIQVIGSGWHQKSGGSTCRGSRHQRSVQDRVLCLSDSTLYVNLEPCSHHGKTPTLYRFNYSKRDSSCSCWHARPF